MTNVPITIEQTLLQLEVMLEITAMLTKQFNTSATVVDTLPPLMTALKTDFARLRRHIDSLLSLRPEPTTSTTLFFEEDPEGG